MTRDQQNPYPRERRMSDGEIIARLDAIATDVAEIRRQTTATNGRVQKLEVWRETVLAVRAAFSWRVPLIVGVTTSVVSGVMVGVILLVIGAQS